MYAVNPLTITSAMLTSSIPEPDTGETVWTAGTYTLGTRRINTTTHRVYEVVADPSTSDDPLVGITKTPKTWVDVGPTNRWAMFDGVNNTQSSGADISVDIVPGRIVNTVAGVNVTGAETVTITVTSASLAVPWTYDVPMVDNSMIADYYDWFFSDLILRTEFVVNNLPSYSDAEINVLADGANVGIGSLLIGREQYIGVSDYGGNLSSLNFGSVTEDSFGNVRFTPGNKAKLTEIPVTIDTIRIGYTYNLLNSLLDVPTVFYATGTIDDPTLTFGYIRQHRLNFKSPSKSDMTLQIRGLT